MSARPFVLAAVCACSSFGCIDTDAAVFVEASVGGAEATVAMDTLANTVSGSCALDLHLGPRASGASDVSLLGFSITSADQASTVVSSLAVTTAPDFPVSVPVDGDVHADVSFAAEDNLIDGDQLSGLCSGELSIKATLDDALRGATISAASPPFTPTGCP